MSDAAHRGLFLAFEGGEGAGKSTQVRLLTEELAGRGRAVRATFEPGDTPAGTVVRQLLLDRADLALSPRAEALLYAADRAQHVDAVLRPALAAGEVVVTDRYVDSSLAYQGAGRAIPREEVAALSRWATGGLVPDLTVLLDLPPVTGLARARGRAAADRMEAESLEFHERVRATFRELAAAEPHRYLVLDATLPADDLAAAIRARVAALLDPALPR
ncbi:dTMP kinase [Trujillonella endophytica]|uniref:Thymidylate kinase n=1 Tax=Trujillonella endophytica TaxID=673521 RepID=A0A1H8WK48_9ACTN|nr:dTMP kinase [Trujillella endophytica]SEP27969.1 dTMP kinase [Trujillella endophytica]